MRRHDGHAYETVFVSLVQILRQAGGFTSENKDDIGGFAERSVPEHTCRFSREEVRIAQVWKFLLENTPAWPYPRLDVFPVVEARSLHLAFTKRKAERFDEVQESAGSKACAAGISRVPVNFRMHEYDMRCHCRNFKGDPGVFWR